ncbi:MAG TPA: alginate lyase family protein [Pyrinomonadaceae bacterium]|jgi:asparagine synthase (glutamine-hydrolysing)|nr:alginate lyase family protein [Pyrinomonadaceae bacterium]
MNRASELHQLWRHFGAEWLVYRTFYAARLRSGLVRRRIPAKDWNEQPLRGFVSDAGLAEPEAYLSYRRGNAPRFFFNPTAREQYKSCFRRWDADATRTPVGVADEIACGTFRYFEHRAGHAGYPPDWHANPFTKQAAPSDRHWSEIADFGHGDIKVIWELSRFGFVYALVRAYWRTGDETYAALFWKLVEDWREKNLPQRGPNWKCGQETSFRVMAWCFGLYGFLDAAETSAERVASLAQMMAISGQRIEANFSYAISQRNNHSISESVGLWTIGTLFPELADAPRWTETGRLYLEKLGCELIYSDGAFVQHSFNYQRLALQAYLWSLRLAELDGQPFSSELRERVGRAGSFLYQLQDTDSGRLPNYGHNDGALILPLNNCDYRDFRPVIQAAHFLSNQGRCYEHGPWDEDLLWLFGPAALEAPMNGAKPEELRAETGGYYTLRNGDGFCFLRCASFEARPGQADMLHLDLWWKGQNIALDAGTYSYNAPPLWNNSLARSAYHNTVTVDDLDQMNQVGKFLWIPWLESRVRQDGRSSGGHLAYLEGEHNGYQRLKPPVTHRRALLRLGDKGWMVLDALDSRGEHRYRLHWLFEDVPYEWNEETGRLTLLTSPTPYHVQTGTLDGKGVNSLVRADEQSPRGWQSPYYDYRAPALSVDRVVHDACSSLFWTVFSAEPLEVITEGGRLRVVAKRWSGAVDLQSRDGGQHSLVSSIAITGEAEDRLEM